MNMVGPSPGFEEAARVSNPKNSMQNSWLKNVERLWWIWGSHSKAGKEGYSKNKHKIMLSIAYYYEMIRYVTREGFPWTSFYSTFITSFNCYQSFHSNNISTLRHPNFLAWIYCVVLCCVMRINRVRFKIKSSVFLAPPNVQTWLIDVMFHI